MESTPSTTIAATDTVHLCGALSPAETEELARSGAYRSWLFLNVPWCGGFLLAPHPYGLFRRMGPG